MQNLLEIIIIAVLSPLGIISLTIITISIIGFIFLHKIAHVKTRIYGTSILFLGMFIFGFSILLATNPANRPPSALANIETKPRPSIIIGGENFLESTILLEIMAKIIEKEVPYLTIIRNHNIGETIHTFSALKEGQIDLYSEYSGTLIADVLNRPFDAQKQEFHQTNKINELLQENESTRELVWTDHFGFNNPYALIILKITAAQKNILDKNGKLTISNLSEISENLIFKSTHEFFYRPDGLRGLKKIYKLNFKETGLIAHQKKYDALMKKEMDVTDAYLTDPQLYEEGNPFLIIDDDKAFFPKYYAGALVRKSSLKKYPGIKTALNRLAGKITVIEMASLIKQGLELNLDKEDLNMSDSAQMKLHNIVSSFMKTKGLL